jgi:hypothetical protein
MPAVRVGASILPIQAATAATAVLTIVPRRFAEAAAPATLAAIPPTIALADLPKPLPIEASAPECLAIAPVLRLRHDSHKSSRVAYLTVADRGA